jgi:hypothetical protein
MTDGTKGRRALRLVGAHGAKRIRERRREKRTGEGKRQP